MSDHGTTFKATLLVAGTTIGGGMLAMPVLTAPGGFFPALFLFLVCWSFMAATGLLFLETALSMEGDVNIISMAKKTLGRGGEIFAWVLYLFLFMTLTLAYVVGCGRITWAIMGGLIPDWGGPLLFVLLFAPFIFSGARLIGRMNIPLMVGLFLSYCAFVFLGYSYVDRELIQRSDWSHAFLALPVAFTAFGYQGIVPTLVRYLNRDREKIRHAILMGSFIPLLVYIVWHFLILGIVPLEGPGGLLEALQQGDTAVQPLKRIILSPYITWIGESFAFFALLTSFLGVALGLRDFLADGLQVKKDVKGRLFLCSLIFIPVLLGALFYPHIFIEALGFAGGYGCALLLGLLPIMMVYSGRYIQGHKNRRELSGGKALLALLAAFVLFEVAIETMHLIT